MEKEEQLGFLGGAKQMYKHCERTDCFISLHNCHAEQMYFENGILSFIFPDGFWVTERHPHNHSNAVVRTNSSQADFQMIDKEMDGMEIYVFKRNRKGKIIREDWTPRNFIRAVQADAFTIEFMTQYKSYQSYLFKCWIWFDQAPYHSECEIILHSAHAVYRWNELRYDCRR